MTHELSASGIDAPETPRHLACASLLLLFAGATVSVLLLSELKIASAKGWLLFGGWTLAPYLAGSTIGFAFRSSLRIQLAHLFGSLIAALNGILLMADAIYLNPDPQGGLAILMVPFWQLPIYALVFGIVIWLQRQPPTTNRGTDIDVRQCPEEA